MALVYNIVHNVLIATNGIRVAGDDVLPHVAVLLQDHDGLTLIGKISSPELLKVPFLLLINDLLVVMVKFKLTFFNILISHITNFFSFLEYSISC